MLKKLLSISLAMVVLAASTAYAATASLASPYNVASTSFASVPGVQIQTQCVNTAFNGGLISLWVCASSVTFKDANQAQLKTRITFNGKVGTLSGSGTNADGSLTRTYVAVSLPGLSGANGYKATAKGQAAKTSANILLDPSTGDIFRIDG